MRGKRNPKPACGHEVKGRCSSRRCLACSKVQAGSTIVGGQVTVPAECSVLLNNSIFHCEKCFANSVDRTCAETKRVTITAPDGSQSRYCNEAKDFHPLEAFEGLDTTVCRPCTNRRRFASPHALRMNMHAEQQSRMQLAGQKRALPQPARRRSTPLSVGDSCKACGSTDTHEVSRQHRSADEAKLQLLVCRTCGHHAET